MNVLTIFEQRIGAIFDEGAPGVRQPFSFRKLAKRMVRQMEDETFVIDGVDTAPALYTILVATEDDAVMHPLYIRITDEMSQLIEAQAKKRGYTFVGRPLVRFMVDPALRHGRFSVFAENIDPRTLARLRDEENAYLGITPPQDLFQESNFVPEPIPAHDEEPSFVASEIPFAAHVAPEVVASVPDGEMLEPEAISEEPGAGFASVADFEEDDFLASSNLDADESLAVPACTLTDLKTGQVYTVDDTRITIGRERSVGTIVLRDPNVSRRHAEVVWDGVSWMVRDLGSTNGTLVNDIDCDLKRLSDGDVLTIGVTSLEFKAG